MSGSFLAASPISSCLSRSFSFFTATTSRVALPVLTADSARRWRSGSSLRTAYTSCSFTAGRFLRSSSSMKSGDSSRTASANLASCGDKLLILANVAEDFWSVNNRA